ncbi:hypothetical protein OIU85_027033 [Salix viminalis]|uniref:Uncharacterized protein n=1 Tax=Salix viminalis TaxID=40686 RepID=A0A9Q0TPU3_SALVM|nr:hypothetical protein OIU85_027033 [Salix viminalis]
MVGTHSDRNLPLLVNQALIFFVVGSGIKEILKRWSKVPPSEATFHLILTLFPRLSKQNGSFIAYFIPLPASGLTILCMGVSSPQPNSSRICERIHKCRQLVVVGSESVVPLKHLDSNTSHPINLMNSTLDFAVYKREPCFSWSRIQTCNMEALYPSSEFSLKEVPRGHLSYRGLIGGGGATVSILFVCWMLYVLMNKYNFSMACSFSISRSRLSDIESPASDT